MFVTPATTLEDIQQEVDGFGHGRVPRDVRRRHILAVAEGLFVERGYAAASMDDLASLAGVSKPVIYDIVGSKDAVFEACVSRVADALADVVAVAVEDAGASDGAAALRAGAVAWFEFIGTRRGLWEALLSSSDVPTTEAIETIRARQDVFVADWLVAVVEAQGREIEHETAGAVATAMNGAFEALGRWWHDHPDRTAAELADLYTALVLPGLAGLFDLVVD